MVVVNHQRDEDCEHHREHEEQERVTKLAKRTDQRKTVLAPMTHDRHPPFLP